MLDQRIYCTFMLLGGKKKKVTVKICGYLEQNSWDLPIMSARAEILQVAAVLVLKLKFTSQFVIF